MSSTLMPRPSARTKYFLSGENFFPKLKNYTFACEVDGKWVFSHGQNFFMAKKHFKYLDLTD